MKSWFYLHADNRCMQENRESADGSGQCTRKAHIGGLCGLCFHGANVLERQMAYLDEEIEFKMRREAQGQE